MEYRRYNVIFGSIFNIQLNDIKNKSLYSKSQEIFYDYNTALVCMRTYLHNTWNQVFKHTETDLYKNN